MNNPIRNLSRREWLLWIGSLTIVAVSNILSQDEDWLTLVAAMVGVTSLVFAAKGNVWAQILMIIFSVLYGIISYRFRYWGEMITYLGMSMLMAIWLTITWIKNPSKENGNEVAIRKLNCKHSILLVFSVLLLQVDFIVLQALNTPNIVFSTISVTTSFLAAALTMLRSSYYALGYASNDIVLIVLWGLASIENPAYIPVIVNFAIFFLMICMDL